MCVSTESYVAWLPSLPLVYDGCSPFTTKSVGKALVPLIWVSGVSCWLPYIHLLILIFLGSVKPSVQNKRSLIMFIPVIDFLGFWSAK